EVATYPSVELSFHPEANLVEFLFSPANLTKEIEIKAQALAVEVITKLRMVGLLAVEMFLTREGELLVNEVAPRTHNSGHHTIEANQTSQFEQHLRAVLNLPLGTTQMLIPAAMVNLLGAPDHTGSAIYEGLSEAMQMPGVHLHLYGKKITKPFRKMGHVTITNEDMSTLKASANQIKNILKVKA
ncbi:MAG: ATP-grasp domain-containing protein, partial [Cytophagales bacterium]